MLRHKTLFDFAMDGGRMHLYDAFQLGDVLDQVVCDGKVSQATCPEW